MSDRERFYADGRRVMLNFAGDGLYRATAATPEDAMAIAQLLNDELDRTEEAVALLRETRGYVACGLDLRWRDYLRDRIDAFLQTFADPSGPDASGDDGKVSTQGAAHEVPRAQPGSQSGGGSAPTCPECGSDDPRLMKFAGAPYENWCCTDPFHDQPEPGGHDD